MLLFLLLLVAQQSSPPSADALFKQGKFQEAAAAYRAILQSGNSSARAYSGLVQSYLKADEVDAAADASRRAMAALPRSVAAHAARADVYFRRGLLPEAEIEYLKALQLDANYARALLGLGRIASAAGQNQQAEKYFTQAHELDPEDGDALYHWAVLLPYPESVKELERHLAEFHSTREDERREREFIELVRGVGERETWVGPKETGHAEAKLETLSPRPGAVVGLGVRAKFNGNIGALLLLDTGANWITIPRKLAEKIGARKISDYAIEGVGDSGPGSGYFAWVDKITVGEIEFRDCVVHVLQANNNSGLDGIAGTNIFAKYSVTIDFPGRKLIVDPLPKGAEAAPIMARSSFSFGHVLLLHTSVNNSASGLFVLDSGANASSISPRLAQTVGKVHEGGSSIAGVSGQVSKVAVLPDAALQFSSVAENKRDLVSFEPHALSRQLGTEVSGFIGFDLLSRRKVRINYRDGLVQFE